MKIAIVGTGYVGLASGVCLAAKGHDVTCVDKNTSIVERLNRAEATIHENGLPELLEDVYNAGNFRATTVLSDAMEGSELVLLAVGTPSKDGEINLEYIRAAAAEIGASLKDRDDHVSVIVKSTVVPGTTDTVVRSVVEQASGKTLGEGFGLGMNPEFLREGEAIEDFMEPDRIVLGHEDAKTLDRLHELYAPWDSDKVAVNTRTAEMIKYANNSLLAVQISAVNEIANLSAAIGGVDVMDVMDGVHKDKRWNPMTGPDNARVNPAILTYLIPGCGFGGSCFPKDVQALHAQGNSAGVPMEMLKAVLSVNANQPGQVRRILEMELGDLADRRVLLLGLAFKPETDDVRESASLAIASDLLDSRCQVMAHDPIATENFISSFGPRASEITFKEDWQSALEDAEIVILATSWAEYSALSDLAKADQVVFDARRFLQPEEIQKAKYLTIGYRSIH
ncbi:MAG: UDP-glucose/GDP-mannose dehydrogenase family protein [Dinoroseobacter sp.]|nr:UDP-glucose/GDP-mannose dehydrogenase family protein [Dinoroseobacter sp.]